MRRQVLRRTAVLLLLLLGLAGCGGSATRSQADQDRDGRLIAAAIRAADNEGARFSLDEALVLSGGDLPRGQEIRLQSSSRDGQLKAGSARLTYRLAQGSSARDYDMVLASGALFAKQRSTPTWHATPISATTSLFPALRLDLIRETVLLASSISSPVLTHVPAGFAHKYVVKPAPDQLEQLEAIPVQGRSEAAFLKTAKAELDIFLGVPGDRLFRVELHLSGTDPSDGSKQQVDSAIDLRSGRVDAIKPPDRAVSVSPAEILG